MNQYDNYLSYDNTVTNDKAGDMTDFLDYFYSVLLEQKILMKNSIPTDDVTYQSYLNNKISLSSFLKYAIANNWVDQSKLGVGTEYNTAQELYGKLINYTKDILKADDEFSKKIYHNLIFSYNLTGKEICLLLFDQGVLKYNEGEYNRLQDGKLSAYDFIVSKMTNLEITPAMLALDPYSGSLVVTDVKTGDILAMVTYPS
jgi:penicillin-binding protein 2